MKKGKRFVAGLLAAALCGSLFSGCGTGSSSEKTKTSSESSTPVKVVMACISFNNIPNDLTKINNKLNEELKKYNVEIDWKLYGPADYQTKCNLALESGTQLDLFLPLNFPSVVSKKQAMSMDDLIDKYAKASKDILYKDFGDDAFKSTTMDGHIYGMPVNKGMSIPPVLIYNDDMLKETGYTKNDIKSLSDLPKIFDKLKAKNPNVICFAPLNVSPNDTSIMALMKGMNKIDYLTDSTGAGVVVGNSGKVVDLYETDIFKNAVSQMRDWYQKGYFQKDIATTTTNATDQFRAGRAFCTLGGYSGKQVDKLWTTMTGKNCGTVRLSDFYFDTVATQLAWVISSTSKVPEAAMKLLNATMTDSTVLNTMLYGIEGEDYTKVDADHVKYPDGQTSTSVPYTAQLCSGVLGSESLQWMLEGTDAADLKVKIEENKSTPRSPYFGFTFDQSTVKTEMSAIQNVYNQYYSGLVCGSVDPATTIPKFVKALKDAGMDTVIQAKQEQLDKWVAEQKK